MLVINACESISKLVPDLDYDGTEFTFVRQQQEVIETKVYNITHAELTIMYS